MKIGVIGSGNIGKSIGAWAYKAGYEVSFAARDEAHAKQAAAAAGPQAKAGPVRSVVEASDVILLAVPYSEVKAALEPVLGLLKGKTLIDVTNPLTPDYAGLVVGHETSAAETIAGLAPQAHVVKAFNTVFAQIYAAKQPQIQGRKLSVFFAGDDKAAKEKVRELIERLGFDAVDSGPLKNARLLEPLALLNIQLGYAQGLGTGIGFALLR